MKTMTRTIRAGWLVLMLSLVGGAALAKTPAQCQRDLKEVRKQCDKACGGDLEKSNAKGAEACRKACSDQMAKIEKRCQR